MTPEAQDDTTTKKSRTINEVSAAIGKAGIEDPTEPPTPKKKTPQELLLDPKDFLEDGDGDEEEGYENDHPVVGEGSGERDWGIDDNGSGKKPSPLS
jgi:hypothetical protein